MIYISNTGPVPEALAQISAVAPRVDIRGGPLEETESYQLEFLAIGAIPFLLAAALVLPVYILVVCARCFSRKDWRGGALSVGGLVVWGMSTYFLVWVPAMNCLGGCEGTLQGSGSLLLYVGGAALLAFLVRHLQKTQIAGQSPTD